MIDGIEGPGGIPGFRGGMGHGWHESPVGLVSGALGDPRFEDGLFLFPERAAEFRGRHQVVGIVGVDPLDQLAGTRVARDDRLPAAFEYHGGTLEGIEAQTGLTALVGVGAVAGETAVGEDGADVAVEIDAGRMHRFRRGDGRDSAPPALGEDESGGHHRKKDVREPWH